MRSRHPMLPTLLAAALFLALPLAAAAFQMSEESSYTFPLAADGRLSLENVNGDVTITGWDRDEVSIEAVKKGRSQEALDAAEIDIDAEADRIHVKTRYRDRGRGRDAASVEYTIHVPRWTSLGVAPEVRARASLPPSVPGVQVKSERSSADLRLTLRLW